MICPCGSVLVVETFSGFGVLDADWISRGVWPMFGFDKVRAFWIAVGVVFFASCCCWGKEMSISGGLWTLVFRYRQENAEESY